MRGVGALPAPPGHQPQFVESFQQQVQDLLLHPVSQETITEARQHSEVEAWIGQVEAE
jgi:hypothetical protein